jgi:hypothetical protein
MQRTNRIKKNLKCEMEKMSIEHPRITREKKTIGHMVHIYCKAKHHTHGELCPECTQFFEYAQMRLDKCPFQENKTTCGKCRIHCYKPDMKDRAKKVMRYSGPRMMLHHPILAMHHAVDGFKSPEKARVKTPSLVKNP